MLPLTCIILDEYAGEKLVNLFLGALYSAILVAGADLYAVSLAALLLPLCIIAGLGIYYHYIFRPAKIARTLRQDKLRKIKLETASMSLSRSKRRGSYSPADTSAGYTKRYFKRVLNIIICWIQDFITLRPIQDDFPRKLAIQREWCDLNRPACCSGMISTEGVKPSTGTPPPHKRMSLLDRSHSRQSYLQHPIQIQRMMTSLMAQKDLQTEETIATRRNSLLFSLPRADDGEGSPPVITKVEVSIKRKKYANPVIVFDAADVLSRLRALLANSAPSFQSTYALHVKLSDLDREFRSIMNIFYPDGIPMSEMEKDEAHELFFVWHSGQDTYTVIQQNGVTYDEEYVISFELFEQWFRDELLGALHSIVKDRLLDRALSYVPKTNKRFSLIGTPISEFSRRTSVTFSGVNPLSRKPSDSSSMTLRTDSSPPFRHLDI